MATLTNPDAVSMDPEKLEQVKQLFHSQIEDGLHPGAGLAVYRHGNLVLDIHGGVSDIRDGSGATQPVTSETMFVLMSSTKPLAASCLYMLKERGQVAWDDLVSKYWPEFGKNGKETVTVRHV
jgi:CubicO group peptidase (beta-lactamase class C family)